MQEIRLHVGWEIGNGQMKHSALVADPIVPLYQTTLVFGFQGLAFMAERPECVFRLRVLS